MGCPPCSPPPCSPCGPCPPCPACCCKSGLTDKMGVMCLNRCDLTRHKCHTREDLRPGPVPRNMGWLYTARDSPAHQLRCGWRPGHISCPVLKRIEAHNCGRCSGCGSCGPPCGPCKKGPCRSSCGSCGSCPRGPCSAFPKCVPGPKCLPCPPIPCKSPCGIEPCTSPSIRIVRHGGRYSIVTKPDGVSNHPSSQYPLKYVLDTGNPSDDNKVVEGRPVKFSVEAKYNDYVFDYTSSQTSFVLDFSPPELGKLCLIPCAKKISCSTCPPGPCGGCPFDPCPPKPCCRKPRLPKPCRPKCCK